MTDETALADLLEFVLAGRPERVTDVIVARMPREQQAGVGLVGEVVATLGAAQEPVAPSAGLRERILATTREHMARRPRRAVVVCDMICDHLAPGRPLEIPRARAIVPALVDRLDHARSAGEPVVYVLDRHEVGDPELDEWGTHALAGTEGAEVWPPLAPKPGDAVVTKPTYSAFFDTRLEGVLDELGVDTLVLTGCATEVQLMATATDALQRGFAIELPPDTQAGNSAEGEMATSMVLAALIPYAPARKARLARIAQRAA